MPVSKTIVTANFVFLFKYDGKIGNFIECTSPALEKDGVSIMELRLARFVPRQPSLPLPLTSDE